MPTCWASAKCRRSRCRESSRMSATSTFSQTDCIASSIRIAPIRPEDAYGGFRATIQALLGSARLHVQVDVGIGDAVVPEPEWLEYPSLLDFPMPRLKVYRPETAIAEKLHAMVKIGRAH